MSTNIVMIDASTYQHLIARLSETLAQKVIREGHNQISGPTNFQTDIFISIRQAQNTYNFLHWVHSDELRATVGWRDTYTVACEPLIRNLIDNLYTITLLLQDPYGRGQQFRASGLRKGFLYVAAEEARYKGKPEWDKWIADGRTKLDILVRATGFTETEVMDKKKFPDWPTLGKYLATLPLDAHKKFLATFTFGPWKQYSSVAHGGPEGLHEVGMFLYRDGHLHEQRQLIDDAHDRTMSLHMMRAAILLLAICTEVQVVYKFKDDGARINERIIESWQALQPAMEAKEIYDEHYEQLMKDNGIMK
ncbi:hypothetical protein JAO29_16810 [Edaphobacter sp. HDX4]|uniref:hypothetical protein n=1 Tax=Edaphobacter sp. HDX4 TaxID=2794064 RepID=UPI002FE5AC41